MGDHWLFMFRWRCHAIAHVTTVHHPNFTEKHIKLCSRWRWHRGECR